MDHVEERTILSAFLYNRVCASCSWTILLIFCERSKLLICMVHHFLQEASLFLGHIKKISPFGFRIRGNFIERNLIGQWQTV